MTNLLLYDPFDDYPETDVGIAQDPGELVDVRTYGYHDDDDQT